MNALQGFLFCFVNLGQKGFPSRESSREAGDEVTESHLTCRLVVTVLHGASYGNREIRIDFCFILL